MSAAARIQELIERTGGPTVKATVTVDQVYAELQHEALEFRHPRGGRAKYLEAPLFENYGKWVQEFATRLLDEGRRASTGWGGVGRNLAAKVATEAPVEFGDLRNSAGLMVREGATVVIDDPARQRRLTEQELDAKDYLRQLGLRYR